MGREVGSFFSLLFSRRKRRSSSRERGTALVEYTVLMAGLSGVLFTTHPPFALKVARPICVAALSLDYTVMETDHLCRNDTYWSQNGVTPPSEYVPTGVYTPTGTPCGNGVNLVCGQHNPSTQSTSGTSG